MRRLFCVQEGGASSPSAALLLRYAGMRRYGPLTVNTISVDSFLPSSVQIAPSASQSSVIGRMIVTAPSELGLTVIRQPTLLPCSSRYAFRTVPPFTVKAWSGRVL